MIAADVVGFQRKGMRHDDGISGIAPTKVLQFPAIRSRAPCRFYVESYCQVLEFCVIRRFRKYRSCQKIRACRSRTRQLPTLAILAFRWTATPAAIAHLPLM